MAKKLLNIFVRSGNRPYLLGDLEENYNRIIEDRGAVFANRWYWFQTIIPFPDFIKIHLTWSTVMFKNYFMVAFRNIKKQKIYSFINFFGLAIGLTCSIVILLFVQHELSYDRFHENTDSIYRIADFQKLASEERFVATTNGELFDKVIPQIQEIEHSSRFILFNQILTVNKNDYNEKICYANPGFFDVFSFELQEGDRESFLKNPNNIAISLSMAKKWFGNDNPIGNIVKIKSPNFEEEFIISGILKDVPINSHFRFDILASYLAFENVIYNKMYTYVILNKNVNLTAVENKINTFSNQYIADDYEHAYFLQPIKSIHLNSHLKGELSLNRQPVYIYATLGIALAILLIACINFINITTARSRLRAKEVGLRKVVGASYSQVIVQFIGEIILYFFIASIIAIFLAIQILPLFNSLAQSDIHFSLKIFKQIIFYAFILSVIVGFIASIYPAFILATFTPSAVLKERYDKVSLSSLIVRKGLVIFQFAVSIIFICGTLFIFRQMDFINKRDLGFKKENVISIPAYGKGEVFIKELLKNANIEDITFSRFQEQGNYAGPPLTWFPANKPNEKLSLHLASVADNFFDFFEIRTKRGRSFSKNYTTDAKNAVMLNEEAVKQLGWKDPLGKQISNIYTKNKYTVIGVISDYHNVSLLEEIKPTIYQMDESGDRLYIRTNSHNINETIAFIKEKAEVTQNIKSFFTYEFLDDNIKKAYQDENRMFSVFQIASILTSIIASMGLLSLIMFSVENRVKEIAIRKILGASVNKVIKLLTGEFIYLILIANILAWPITFIIIRNWLNNFYYRIDITVWPFVFSCILAIVLSLISVGSITYRAAFSNPANSLRNE